MSIEVDKAVSYNEAARRLGVTYSTIRNWVDKGYLPMIRVGSVKKIREADLEDFITNPPEMRGPGRQAQAN